MASKDTQNQPEGFHKFKKKTKKKFGSGEFENKIEKKVKKVKAGPKKFGSGEFENKIKKTRKLGSGEFDDTSKKVTKKVTQNQPEGSGARKKILGPGEFADTSKKVNKTSKKVNKTSKTSTPTSFGAAFKAARAKQGAGGVFTYKGKKYTTNRADDKKASKKKKVITKTTVAVDSEKFKPKNPRGPKVKVRQGTPDQKRGTKVQKASEKASEKASKKGYFEKMKDEIARNFSGDFKKGTGRYKLISTGKTNFNKKKK